MVAPLIVVGVGVGVSLLLGSCSKKTVDNVYDINQTSYMKENIEPKINKEAFTDVNMLLSKITGVEKTPEIDTLVKYIQKNSKVWSFETLMAIYLKVSNVGHWNKINKAIVSSIMDRNLSEKDSKLIYDAYEATGGHIFYVNGYESMLIKAINSTLPLSSCKEIVNSWNSGHLSNIRTAALKKAFGVSK
jgi:hypothetical protein